MTPTLSSSSLLSASSFAPCASVSFYIYFSLLLLMGFFPSLPSLTCSLCRFSLALFNLFAPLCRCTRAPPKAIHRSRNFSIAWNIFFHYTIYLYISLWLFDASRVRLFQSRHQRFLVKWRFWCKLPLLRHQRIAAHLVSLFWRSIFIWDPLLAAALRQLSPSLCGSDHFVRTRRELIIILLKFGAKESLCLGISTQRRNTRKKMAVARKW